MGVAALGQTWERTTGSQLTDLLAGADRALYQAKNAGRNHVVMVTDTETVGTGTETVRTVADPGRLSRLSALLPGGPPRRGPSPHEPEIRPTGPGQAELVLVRAEGDGEADRRAWPAREDLRRPLRALRRVAGAEDLGGVVPVHTAAFDGDRPAAAVARRMSEASAAA